MGNASDVRGTLVKTIRAVFVLVAAAMAGRVMVAAAAAACIPADLQGNWVFRLDIPQSPVSQRTDSMVCPVTIRANGTIPPATCDQLDQTLNKGQVSFTGDGRFVVSPGCAVRLNMTTGSFYAPYSRGGGAFTPYAVTALRAWMSPDKQMFMGAFSHSGGYYAIGITAMKR